MADRLCLCLGILCVFTLTVRVSYSSTTANCPLPEEVFASECEDNCETDKDCPKGTRCCPGSCKRSKYETDDESKTYRSCMYPDRCSMKPCQHNGTCIPELYGGLRCMCTSGWGGDRCEKDIDECLSNPCKNDGVCHDLVNDYKCCCPLEFTGKNCEQKNICPDTGIPDQCSHKCEGHAKAKCVWKLHFIVTNDEGEEEDITGKCSGGT